MRKHRKSATKVLLATIVLTAGISLSAYAAEWKQDTTGWQYEQDGGGYATGWQWIDGKCYYFADNGYMLANTEVDGYTLNADGQWTVDGVVQTQGVSTIGEVKEITSHEVENKNFAYKQGIWRENEILFVYDMYGNPLKNTVLAGSKFSTNENGRLLYMGNEIPKGTYIYENISDNWQIDTSKPAGNKGISNYYFTNKIEFELNGQIITESVPVVSQWLYLKDGDYLSAYCFNEQGYLYINAVTPDGYTVNENGQLIINNIVVKHKGSCYDNSSQLLYFKDFPIGDLRWEHIGKRVNSAGMLFEDGGEMINISKTEPKKELTEEDWNRIGEMINQDTSIPGGSTQGQTIQSN